MEDLTTLRQEIDRIDRQITDLFEQRMAVTQKVGEYKLQQGLPVLDEERERRVLAGKAALLKDPSLAPDITELFQTVMAISRRQQRRLIEAAESSRSEQV